MNWRGCVGSFHQLFFLSRGRISAMFMRNWIFGRSDDGSPVGSFGQQRHRPTLTGPGTATESRPGRPVARGPRPRASILFSEWLRLFEYPGPIQQRRCRSSTRPHRHRHAWHRHYRPQPDLQHRWLHSNGGTRSTLAGTTPTYSHHGHHHDHFRDRRLRRADFLGRGHALFEPERRKSTPAAPSSPPARSTLNNTTLGANKGSIAANSNLTISNATVNLAGLRTRCMTNAAAPSRSTRAARFTTPAAPRPTISKSSHAGGTLSGNSAGNTTYGHYCIAGSTVTASGNVQSTISCNISGAVGTAVQGGLWFNVSSGTATNNLLVSGRIFNANGTAPSPCPKSTARARWTYRPH